MPNEIQPRWQCQICLKNRDAEVASLGSSSIPYQFNEANAIAHILANVTHVVQPVFVVIST